MGIPIRQRFEVLDMLVKWKKLMEKQTGRKIKMVQFGHFGEYKDQFLQFGQNNCFGIHFTVSKHRVAKKMNRSLL